MDEVNSNNNYSSSARFLIYLLLSFSLFNYVINGFYGGIKYKGGDFLNYYVNAKLLLMGVDIHNDELRENAVDRLHKESSFMPKRHHQPDYPPFWYLCISPLTVFNWGFGFNIWVALNQLFLVMVIYLLFRYFELRLFSITGVGLIFLILNFFPLWYNMMEGQINLFILLLIMCGLWAFRRDKEWLAGSLLGLAAGIKLLPALLIFYFLWKGNWRVVLFGFISFAATVLITVIGAGYEITASYFFTQLPKYGGVPRAEVFNQSINGFVSRLFTCSDASDGWINDPSLAMTITSALSLIVLGITLYITRGRSTLRSFQWDMGFAIFILVMLLTSSWTLEHHYVLLFFVWCIFLKGFIFEKSFSISEVSVAVVMFAILAIATPHHSDKFNSGLLILIKSLKFYPVLVLWIILLRRYRGIMRVN